MLAVLLVLAGGVFCLHPASALATDRWSDISDQTWLDVYGITAARADGVADGYPDGTFRPYNSVTRAQFAKMAVEGLGLAKATPAVPTFDDVSPSDYFYPYIEGARAAGITNGVTSTLFDPQATITRQQANSMLGRYLSDRELVAMGGIWSYITWYPSLAAFSEAESQHFLGAFYDLPSLDDKHRPGTAYLVFHDVVNGSKEGPPENPLWMLHPLSSLARAQAVAMVLRTYDAVDEVAPGPPPAPVNLESWPASPSTESRPLVSGKSIPGGTVTVFDTYEGSLILVGQVNADQSTGEFSLRIPADSPLAEGQHQLTARVRNRYQQYSVYSLPLTYVVDTTPPQVIMEYPLNGSIVDTANPLFTAVAADSGSGIAEVGFFYAADGVSPVFQSISVDVEAPYRAEWGGLSLPDGPYIFRATARDGAGNVGASTPAHVYIDTRAPEVAVLAPGAGEQLTAGIPYPITWQVNDVSPTAAVAVYLSMDGGAVWTLIGGQAGNPGHLDWTPPAVTEPVSGCLIRVEVTDTFGRTGSASSGPFGIEP